MGHPGPYRRYSYVYMDFTDKTASVLYLIETDKVKKRTLFNKTTQYNVRM